MQIRDIEQYLRAKTIDGREWVSDVLEALVLSAESCPANLEGATQERSLVDELLLLDARESRLDYRKIQSPCEQLQIHRQHLIAHSQPDNILEQFRIFNTAIDCPEFYELH